MLPGAGNGKGRGFILNECSLILHDYTIEVIAKVQENRRIREDGSGCSLWNIGH